MPAFAFSRQPEAGAWFGSGQGKALLVTESLLAERWLVGRPAHPVLWLAPSGHQRREDSSAGPVGRRLCLQTHDSGFEGDVRCSLPLPLPTESVGSVIVQHACEIGPAGLLDECARVLAPGGRLLLLSLNPLSLYRFRWGGQGLRVAESGRWQEALRHAGLHAFIGEEQYLGPLWRRAMDGADAHGAATSGNRLRAVCVQEAEKRAVSPIQPLPARRGWNAGAAPA